MKPTERSAVIMRSRVERLVSDAGHLSLSRQVVEIAWWVDHGQAGRVRELFVPGLVLDVSGTPLAGHDAIRNSFIRADAGWRFASRTFETLFA